MLALLLAQSASYPKLWMFTLWNPGSMGSQNWGQKKRGSFPFCHVFTDPPRNPWTNIMSINGSGDECRRRNPSGPRDLVPFSSSLLRLFWAHELVKRFFVKGLGRDATSFLAALEPEDNAAELSLRLGERDLGSREAPPPRLWFEGVSLGFRRSWSRWKTCKCSRVSWSTIIRRDIRVYRHQIGRAHV